MLKSLYRVKESLRKQSGRISIVVGARLRLRGGIGGPVSIQAYGLEGGEPVQSLEIGDLCRREIGMPKIDDQDDTGFGRVIPRLMLERIVEYQTLAFLPAS